MEKLSPPVESTAVRLPLAVEQPEAMPNAIAPVRLSGEEEEVAVVTVAEATAAPPVTEIEAARMRSGAAAKEPAPETSADQLAAVGTSSGVETTTLSAESVAGPTVALGAAKLADQPAPQTYESVAAPETVCAAVTATLAVTLAEAEVAHAAACAEL
jgi:hypothetical protein